MSCYSGQDNGNYEGDGTYTECLDEVYLSDVYTEAQVCADLQIAWGSDDYWGDINNV